MEKKITLRTSKHHRRLRHVFFIVSYYFLVSANNVVTTKKLWERQATIKVAIRACFPNPRKKRLGAPKLPDRNTNERGVEFWDPEIKETKQLSRA